MIFMAIRVVYATRGATEAPDAPRGHGKENYMKRIAMFVMLVALPLLVLAGCEPGGIETGGDEPTIADTQAATDEAAADDDDGDNGDEGEGAGTQAKTYIPCKLITLNEAVAAVKTKLEVTQDDTVAKPPQPMVCQYFEPTGTQAKYSSVQLSIHSPATLATGMTAEVLFNTMKSYVTNVQEVANLGDSAYYTKDVEAQGLNVLLKSKGVYFKVNVNLAVDNGTKLDNSLDVAKELAETVIDKL